jgi:hypothetical protein
MLDKQSLTPAQFKKIINHIWKYHRFGGLSGLDRSRSPYIKYIRPNWDMRDGCIFSISFDDEVFDFRDSEEPLYDRIKKWLGMEDDETEEYELTR